MTSSYEKPTLNHVRWHVIDLDASLAPYSPALHHTFYLSFRPSSFKAPTRSGLKGPSSLDTLASSAVFDDRLHALRSGLMIKLWRKLMIARLARAHRPGRQVGYYLPRWCLTLSSTSLSLSRPSSSKAPTRVAPSQWARSQEAVSVHWPLACSL